MTDNPKSKTCPELCRRIKNRKWAGILAVVFTFVFGGVEAQAQQPKKIPRIGYLTAQTSSAEFPRIDAFRQGLRALGYVEGQNIAIEYRSMDGKLERLPEVAAELVRLKVDVLIPVSTNAALAAKRATSTVPIFFMGVPNPVEVGLVESLARPGGNITGLTNIASVLSGKRLEVLKETIPKLSRVAVLWDPQNPGSAAQWKESEIAAKELRLQIYSTQVSSADKYESAFKATTRAGSMGLAVTRLDSSTRFSKAQSPLIFRSSSRRSLSSSSI